MQSILMIVINSLSALRRNSVFGVGQLYNARASIKRVHFYQIMVEIMVKVCEVKNATDLYYCICEICSARHCRDARSKNNSGCIFPEYYHTWKVLQNYLLGLYFKDRGCIDCHIACASQY
jgi:hypothetical protein